MVKLCLLKFSSFMLRKNLWRALYRYIDIFRQIIDSSQTQTQENGNSSGAQETNIGAEQDGEGGNERRNFETGHFEEPELVKDESRSEKCPSPDQDRSGNPIDDKNDAVDRLSSAFGRMVEIGNKVAEEAEEEAEEEEEDSNLFTAAYDSVLLEWNFVARCIDRVFFIIYVIINIIAILIFRPETNPYFYD